MDSSLSAVYKLKSLASLRTSVALIRFDSGKIPYVKDGDQL